MLLLLITNTMETPIKELVIKVGTYNINYSRRADGDFGAYHWSNRNKYVYELMNTIGATVWCVQEIHQDNIVEFTETMKEHHWYIQPQNSRGGKLTSIAIGVKKDYNISDIEWIAYNFNQHHSAGEVVVGCLIKSIQTLIVSTHFPMDQSARKSMVENFEKFINLHTYHRLVISGDFNSFPNDWGYQQIPFLNAVCGTYSSSEYAIYKSIGVYAKHSFKPYPYDVVPENALKMVGKLDHIFVKKLRVKCDTSVIIHDDYIPNTMIHPSDHYPISATLTDF